jgi:hypothetical protein
MDHDLARKIRPVRRLLTLLVVGGSLCPGATGRSEPGATQASRVGFEPFIADETPIAALKGLTVFLEVEPDQATGAKPLTFRVRLENGSTASIAVKNPYEQLTYSLTGEDDWPISQKAPPSRIKVPETGKELRPKYLRVVGVTSGKAKLPAEAEVARDVVQVPPGSSYSYDLRIEKVVLTEGQEAPTPIGSGTYGLQCLLSLLPAEPADSPGVILQTERVTVQLH